MNITHDRKRILKLPQAVLQSFMIPVRVRLPLVLKEWITESGARRSPNWQLFDRFFGEDKLISEHFESKFSSCF